MSVTWRTRLRIGLLLGVVIAGPVWATESPAPALTEVERLAIENLELKAALRQLRADAAQREADLMAALLRAERQALEERLRARLQPPAGAIFDWATQRFVTPPADGRTP